MVYLGAHVSVAGGLPKAVERAVDLGCDALQIFVKNANQWRAKPLADDEAAAFRDAHRAAGLAPAIAHASYLINLAAEEAAEPELCARSCAALADELDRAERLGLAGLVVHPGAHKGAGEEAGIERIAGALDRIFAERPAPAAAEPTRVLLENTAGQGTALGYRLEHLAAIRAAVRPATAERIGFCLDTCHAFAAGYAIHTAEGLDDFLGQAERLLGAGSIAAFHLNDSKKPFGSRRDRHENIGQGEIGAEAFGRLLADPRAAGRPAVIETPAGDDLAEHRQDLDLLKSLRPL